MDEKQQEMSGMIDFYNLSKGQEDAFVIKIKRDSDEIVLLVDGGKNKDYINDLKSLEINKIDYIVLTHVDNDHIKGLIKLLEQNFCCDDATIIYNKFVNGLISYRQAERFEKLIKNKSIIVSYLDYQDKKSADIIFLSAEQRKKLVKNDDEIYFTFLGPSKNEVENLYSAYEYYKKFNKLKSNNAEIVNKSSIMFMLEYKENTIVMLGDGYISDINSKLQILTDSNQTYCSVEKISLLKIPHHGSENNNMGIQTPICKLCNDYVLTTTELGDVEIGQALIENLINKKIYVSNKLSAIAKLNLESDCEITEKTKITLKDGIIQ